MQQLAQAPPYFSGQHREEVTVASTTPQVQEQQQRYIKRHPYLPNDASNFLHGEKVKNRGTDIRKHDENPAQPHNEVKTWQALSSAEGQG